MRRVSREKSACGRQPGSAVFAFSAMIVALAFVTPSSRALAQASVEVLVLDQATNAGIPRAAILVGNTETGYRASDVSGAGGRARFGGLSTAGRYVVSVPEGLLFYGVSSEPITLRSNEVRSVTLTLTARARVKGEETVPAGGASVATLNAVNAEVSSSLREFELRELPVEGRDLTRALYRLPNVVQATGFYSEAPNVSINGANSLYANYTLDGLDNNENFLGGEKFQIPTGFTREVTVLTNNYSTEFGRTGNGVINVTTKSGGNAFHGELFYLGRPGPSLDASSPFAQRDLSGNQVKDGFRRSQGGFGLGGPLARDRTFFYVNAEYTRDVKDNLLNSPGLGVNETVRGENTFPYFSGRLDQRWSDRFNSTLRANVGAVSIERQGGGLDGGVTFPSAGNFQDRNSTLVALLNSYFTGRLLSETNVQYSRFRWNYARPEDRSSPQVVVYDPVQATVGVLGHPGYVFDDTERTVQAQQKFTFLLGRHTLKAGAEIISSDFALAGGGNPNGNYAVQLTDAQLAALRARGLGSSLSIYDIPADARVLDYNVEVRPATFGKRQKIASFYVDDQISAGPRLTLNVGLRYDYDDLSVGGAAHGDRNNLAPRLSANYQIDERSTVRAGFGIFYDKVVYAVYSDALQQNTISDGYRSQVQQLIAMGLLPAGTDLSRVFFDGNFSADLGSVPYLKGPPGSALAGQRERLVSNELRILNPNGYDNPGTTQASLGYQRQLDKNVLFYADLIYTHTNHLFRLRNLNAPAPYPIDPNNVVVRTPGQANATRPVAAAPGGALNVVVTEDEGTSRYTAASFNLVKDRGSDPWAFRLSYTLSRLMNDTEDINFRAMDANNFDAEWGPSINDRTHVISAILYVYPARGLSISLAGLFQSGQPVNRIPDAGIYGTTDLNGDGRSFGDAYVGNNDRQPGESRNSDRLPWSKTVDLGVAYRLPFFDERVEVRADVFNLFNSVNLSGYSNNATQSNQIQVGPPGAGIAEKNAGAPRQFQFGVRYVF